MKYQILKYNPAPEAFYFERESEYRNGHRPIRQWDTLEEAKEAVRRMLDFCPTDLEHIIVTVHAGFSHTTTYPPVKPVHIVKEFTLESIEQRDKPQSVAAVDPVGEKVTD